MDLSKHDQALFKIAEAVAQIRRAPVEAAAIFNRTIGREFCSAEQMLSALLGYAAKLRGRQHVRIDFALACLLSAVDYESPFAALPKDQKDVFRRALCVALNHTGPEFSKFIRIDFKGHNL